MFPRFSIRSPSPPKCCPDQTHEIKGGVGVAGTIYSSPGSRREIKLIIIPTTERERKRERLNECFASFFGGGDHKYCSKMNRI